MAETKGLITDGWFSSDLQEWETPAELFDVLNDRFQFNLDPCASPKNAKCDRFFTSDDDGLKQDWIGRVFMNPPYRDLADWIAKGVSEIKKGHCELLVTLTPARPDTIYFHEFFMRAKEIWFVKGRIPYINPFKADEKKSPFPSMICIFDKVSLNGCPIVKSFDYKSLQLIKTRDSFLLDYF